ncbi:class I tRNA ligase family protein [Candidatus Uhrbacteria bacterium]|nr:class I tRNA ligase family protein [Candidatus Uhrbacteria bacterium]
MFDLGLVPTSEPYARRTSHGLILAEDGEKMSKSRGNVINPDEVVVEFGADTLRCYEMFIGPFDQPVPWNKPGLVGVRRFLERVMGIKIKSQKTKVKSGLLERVVHQTVKKVTEDIEAMKFNTAVSQMMICVNAFANAEIVPQDLFELFLKALSPFAPHLAEELWQQLGYGESIVKESWPTYDPELAKDIEIELVVQVNGRVRSRLIALADLPEDELKAKALAAEKIQPWIKDKKIKQVIVARGKLVNIVTE